MVRIIEDKFDSYKESQGRNTGSSPVPTTNYKNVMVNGKRKVVQYVCKEQLP